MLNRRPYRGCLPPAVHLMTLAGMPAVVVSLTGAFGRGYDMTLDPDAWEALKAAHGDQWTRDRDKTGRWFVGSLPRREVRVAREVLREIPTGSVIRHRNHDYRDCRRANLVMTQV